MGAIAESITSYAQPLLDKTDGSIEEMNRALSLGQICWNLALIPEGDRDDALREMAISLEMEADAFEAFRCTVIAPMIQRHEEMFPRMHGLGSTGGFGRNIPAALPARNTPLVPEVKHPAIGRNEPCPCNSGKKYKKCCGR